MGNRVNWRLLSLRTHPKTAAVLHTNILSNELYASTWFAKCATEVYKKRRNFSIELLGVAGVG